MKPEDLLRQRLFTHHLEGQSFEGPEAVVRWFGAVQAQDYEGAVWAVCQRTAQTTMTDFKTAFANGAILRTHILRPTWHFVLPEDIRWMLALAAPQMKQGVAHYYRKFDLDEPTLRSTNEIIGGALEGAKHLTRKELATALNEAGMDIRDTIRLTHILYNAEADGLICSGAPQGKQQTYALLAERAPQAKVMDPANARIELAKRYFTSHGPATLKDFTWWSGLNARDAREALDAVKAQLISEQIGSELYWFTDRTPTLSNETSVHLLPNYDEYVVAYTDRTALFDERHAAKLDSRQNVLFNNVIIVQGRIVGTWKRVIAKKQVEIVPTLFEAISPTEQAALMGEITHYRAGLTSL